MKPMYVLIILALMMPVSMAQAGAFEQYYTKVVGDLYPKIGLWLGGIGCFQGIGAWYGVMPPSDLDIVQDVYEGGGMAWPEGVF